MRYFVKVPAFWGPQNRKIFRRSAPEKLGGPLREGRSAASPRRIPFFHRLGQLSKMLGQLLTATLQKTKFQKIWPAGREAGRPDFLKLGFLQETSATWIFRSENHRSCVPFTYRSIAAAGSKIDKGKGAENSTPFTVSRRLRLEFIKKSQSCP